MSDASPSIMPEALTATNWEVVPQGFFSRHFDVQQDGRSITSLQMNMFTEGAGFELGGHEFLIRRESIWGDKFELLSGDQTFCQIRGNFWQSKFTISAGDSHWALARVSWFSRTFNLTLGERSVGTVRPAGWFTRKRIAEFSDEVPPPICVLAIWLVILLGRRQEQSAGS